jgi:7-cyano-7-deazaguanine synthase
MSTPDYRTLNSTSSESYLRETDLYERPAVVVFSGGQDSTTCLALALQRHQTVHAITFHYHQRHRIELDAARAVATALDVSSHVVVELGHLFQSTSPLVSDNPVAEYSSVEALPSGIEATFVPGRNILFLTVGAGHAHALGARDLYIGVCEADFGGYWDCRGAFIAAMQRALSQGIDGNDDSYTIHTPLLSLSKKEAVLMAQSLLGQRFSEVFALTHTCYQGVRGGCGKCHACLLRDRGFQEAGVDDPLWTLRAAQAAR